MQMSIDYLKQLRLQYKFPLLVLLAGLVGLVILPPHCFIALSAYDVSDDMSSCCHVPLHCFGSFDVHDAGEEEGFAMLAAEVLRWRAC